MGRAINRAEDTPAGTPCSIYGPGLTAKGIRTARKEGRSELEQLCGGGTGTLVLSNATQHM